MSLPADFLFFVEDPGAANHVEALPAALRARGHSAALVTAGLATRYLAERGVSSEPAGGFRDAPSLLAAFSPRVLVVGTAEDPDTLAHSLVDLARSRAIPSAGVVDGRANALARFRGRSSHPLAHVPDHVLVPDELTRREFAAAGLADGRIHACGHPHHDRVREIRARLDAEGRAAVRQRVLPAASGRPLFLFAAEVSTGLDPALFRRSPLYTLAGSGRHDGRTEIVLEEFLAAVGGTTFLVPPYLVLRLHPKNTPEEYAEFAAYFDLVSRGGPPFDLLYAADLVAGMTSMILEEAALLGRPTLSILPRDSEREWLATIALGVTPCVSSREALESFLASCAWEGPPADASLAFPAGSIERTVSVLEAILGGTPTRGPIEAG